MTNIKLFSQFPQKTFGSLKFLRMFAVRTLHTCAENSVQNFKNITILRSFSQFISHFGAICDVRKTEGATLFFVKNNNFNI